MTEHVHEWELGDIGTTLHVRVGYVCALPSCSDFLTVTQVGVRLNATERFLSRYKDKDEDIIEVVADLYADILEESDGSSTVLRETQRYGSQE